MRLILRIAAGQARRVATLAALKRSSNNMS